MTGRADGEDVIRRCRGRAGDPDNHTLPVVAVAEVLRGVIFWEVPGVHEGIGVGVCGIGFAASDVDLTGARFAVTVGGASGIQAAASSVS